MLQIKNLHCGYGKLEVVKGVTLHVSSGEIVTLIGANGAGKTTLMNAIIGLLPTWSGETRIAGHKVTGQPAWRNIFHEAALVPEGRQLFADMSVMDNLIIGGYRNPNREEVIKTVLDRFPRLRERATQLAGTLSGGEQQMLAIGRAMIAKPRLLLLDEPSMGLAPILVQEVFTVIRELQKTGVTIFLVEQNAASALEVADRAYVIETGEIIMEGRADDLLNNPEVKRAYLGKGYKEVWE
jgi:branched-chain amino acid transport system ATP-binding protein